MKVGLIGSRGFIGHALQAKGDGQLMPLNVDIRDRAQIAAAIERFKPEVIINAAGKTGRPNVDWCESHRLETVEANVTGPLLLAEECLKRSILLVQIGTGCIYTGDNGGRGFLEDDSPNFDASYYSRSKLHLEALLRDFPVLILRPRMPFDGTPHERNLIVKLSSYTAIVDSRNSMTCIDDLARATWVLIEKMKTGVFNVVNPGAISPVEIMELYQAIVDPAHTFEILSPSQLNARTLARRSNCVLSVEKLESVGIALPPVRQAVISCLEVMASERRQTA